MMKKTLALFLFLSAPILLVSDVQADELDSILDYLIVERETEISAEAELEQKRVSEQGQARARLANPISAESQQKGVVTFEKAQETVFESR